MENLALTEVEILESVIKQLQSDKQRLEEENQGLQQKIDSLQSEAERKADSERRLREEIASQHTIRYEELKAAVDQLQADLDQKTDEAEQLFEDLQELKEINREEMADRRRALSDCADLLTEKDEWEKKMDRVIEDNTVIILTVLTSQTDLEEDLSRKMEILNTFSARALQIIKDTRRRIEGIPLTPVYGGEGSEFHEDEDETENVVNVMLWPLMEELNAIANVFRRIRREEW